MSCKECEQRARDEARAARLLYPLILIMVVCAITVAASIFFAGV